MAVITVSTTSAGEARAVIALLQAAPRGLPYEVYLLGSKVAACVTGTGSRITDSEMTRITDKARGTDDGWRHR